MNETRPYAIEYAYNEIRFGGNRAEVLGKLSTEQRERVEAMLALPRINQANWPSVKEALDATALPGFAHPEAMVQDEPDEKDRDHARDYAENLEAERYADR